MIPKPDIAKWQQHAPWKEFAQIEQDLIISRALNLEDKENDINFSGDMEAFIKTRDCI